LLQNARQIDSHPLLSWRDYKVKTFAQKRQLVEDLNAQWKMLWRDRIDDKVRAEAISAKDYSQLFVERGTVILATRRFKPPDFYEILQQHLLSDPVNIENVVVPPNPAVGGWGKFIRTALNKQHPKRPKRSGPIEPKKKTRQQLKKSGKGWLHYKR